MKEHEFGVVGQLHAEPIPADLFGLELMSEKFVVHPGEARDLECFSVEHDAAVCREARQRNVVRRVASAGCLLADTVFALNHRRFFRPQRESQCKIWINCFERLVVAIPLDLPVSIPDASVMATYPGDAGARAICALGVIKMAAVEIA